MDQTLWRRDEGNRRSTFLTSLLIVALIILAPNEKTRVINHTKVGGRFPGGLRLTVPLNEFTSFVLE
jgi:hypothetical protein